MILERHWPVVTPEQASPLPPTGMIGAGSVVIRRTLSEVRALTQWFARRCEGLDHFLRSAFSTFDR